MQEPPRATGPAAAYRRHHPPVRNVNAEFAEKSSFGERVADRVAATVGSWPFIIVQSTVLFGWIAFNVYLAAMARAHPGFLRSWDPYPFILLNLVLSFQAAYTGPVVMMSQNRQAARDRLSAEHDYEINKRAEEEIEVIIRQLIHEDRGLSGTARRLDALSGTAPASELTERLDRILARLEETDRRVVAIGERMTRAERDG
jgi:uncharacterized membrane protein